MSPLYTPCHTRHYNQRFPHLPLFVDHLHLALFADHIHTTPRKPSPTPGAFGAQVSDNIRRDVIIPIF